MGGDDGKVFLVECKQFQGIHAVHPRPSLLHVSLNRGRFEKTCSNSKCYSGLCASGKRHGAVGPHISG
ncbi:hypothetical protein GHJ82_24810 [Sinorhizobium saheli]|nr:hypothetical protein [Sinorhizobium saheli]